MYMKKDTGLLPFIPMPRFIIESNISVNAKLAYGLIYNRAILSQINNWIDNEGNVYVIYTITELAGNLGLSERTINNVLNELEKAGFIKRKRKGLNRPNYIYVIIPTGVKPINADTKLPEYL